MKLYHGSNIVVDNPEILKVGFNKDFGYSRLDRRIFFASR